jgi:uncharacterized protein YdhG (YjbR/CyaY superfamily)
MPNTKLASIDEYIAAQAEELQPILTQIREIIRTNAPAAQERMSWAMPTFWQGENLIHFAVGKSHIGIYPGAEAIEHFADRLTGYKTSKGAIHFPLVTDESGKLLPLDYALIAEITRYRVLAAFLAVCAKNARKLTVPYPFVPKIPTKEGEESFPVGLFQFNITKMIEDIECGGIACKLVDMPVEQWKHLAKENAKQEDIDAADLNKPIIVAEISPDKYGVYPSVSEQKWIQRGYNVIDGHHRLTKAIQLGVESLKAYIVPMEMHVRYLYKGYEEYVGYWNDILKAAIKDNSHPQVLYHYTNLFSIDHIFGSGYLRLTASNHDFANPNLYPVVWLTSSPMPDNHGLVFDDGMPDALIKNRIRIAIRYKPSFKLWDKWSKDKGIDQEQKEMLIETAHAEETYRTWYVSEREISVRNIIKVEDLKTGEVLYDLMDEVNKHEAKAKMRRNNDGKD